MDALSNDIKSSRRRFLFYVFSQKIARFAGHWLVFLCALLSIAIWLLSGFLFDFSNTWQLVINTATTIVTF